MNLRRIVASVVLLPVVAGALAFAAGPQATPPATPADVVPATPAGDPAKRREIERLLELSGTRAMIRSQIDAMTANFERMNMKPEEIAAVRNEFLSGLEPLVQSTIDIYERNLTLEEIRAFVAFYESPAGQKVSKAMPAILRESNQAGMKWCRGCSPGS